MLRKIILHLLAAFLAAVPGAAAAEDAFPIGRLLLDAGIAPESRGICLDLGCGDGKLAVEIARNTRMIIFALAEDENDCAAARKNLDEAGIYGTRATVVTGSLRRVPVPNLYCNLIVTGRYRDSLDMKEVMRLLNPNGVAIIGGAGANPHGLRTALEASGLADAKIVGSFAIFRGRMPDGVDEWTHITPRPDNLLTTRDPRIRPPFVTRWIQDDPSRPGQSACIADGRLIFRQETNSRILAMDVFNGTIKWERRWENKFQGGYALVGGIFYSAELNRIIAMDASNGELRREYRLPEYDGVNWKYRTTGWFEGRFGEKRKLDMTGPYWWWIAMEDGRLYGLAQTPTEKNDNAHLTGNLLCAFDATDGRVLWKYESKVPIYSPSLALSGGKLCFFSLEIDTGGQPGRKARSSVWCLDAGTGKPFWGGRDLGGLVAWDHHGGAFPTSGCSGGRYFVWKVEKPGGEKSCLAFDMETGSLFREYPGVVTDRGPNLVVGNRMFYSNAGFKSKKGQGSLYRCVDIETGAQIPCRIGGDILKNGCGIGNAAPNCIFEGGQGFGSYDLETGRAWEHLFYRTACDFGPLVGNGMVVHLPSYCQCEYPQWAALGLAPAGTDWTPPAEDRDMPARLLKGPAFDAPLGEEGGEEWTHFHGNAGHSGEVSMPVKVPFRVAWQRRLGGRLTPPSCGGGLLFVGSREGAVWALDQRSGEPVWKFLCGAGVRVTPSYGRGRTLFGSDDGWVYCLDARTGRLSWRFRAAPEEHYIHVEGQFNSLWPSAAGVVVERDIAYCAGGYFSYDGAYLYALELASGRPIWARRIGDLEQQQGPPQGIMALAGDCLIMPVFAVHFDNALHRTCAYRKSDGSRIPWYPQGGGRHSRRHMWSGTIAVADGDAFFQGGVRRGRPYGRGNAWPFAMMDSATGWSYGSPFASGFQTHFSGAVAPVLGKTKIVGDGNIYDRATVSERLKSFSSPEKGVPAIRKEDAIALWKGGSARSLALAGDTVVVAWSGEVAAYEAKRDGRKLCGTKVPGQIILNGLATAKGMIFVAT
ncbi:MAG: PQQ-binding-like beta-propeller repeat protein [Planctomycetota bacterium]|nr:PQQ-binding-like beta-propeller repeat protein [Planctomycetota bacterium]